MATDRYLTTFEDGTLDERACGHRLRDLAVKLDPLKARQEELAQLTGHEPAPPDPQRSSNSGVTPPTYSPTAHPAVAK